MSSEEKQPQGVFKKTLEMITANKEKKEKGGYVSIPFGLGPLDNHVPGVAPGIQYIVTANSGVFIKAKPQFAFIR